MRNLFPRKTVLVVAQNPDAASALLERVMQFQSSARPADWNVPLDRPLSLAKDGARFLLRRSRFSTEIPIYLVPRVRKTDTLPVEISATPTPGRYTALTVYLSLADPPEMCSAFLNQTIAALNARSAAKPRAAIIVIDDALSILTPGQPAMDALEAWERARIGLPRPVSSMMLASDMRAWRGPLIQLNKRMQQRLSALEETLAQTAETVGILPVSQTGFHATTGEILANGTKENSVPFNFKALVQGLGGELPEGIPRYSARETLA